MKTNKIKCKACPIHREGCLTNCMSGSGDLGGIVFIGEAPGEQEDLHSTPFVGPAGRLLRGIIKDTGLDCCPVYYTNVVRCRPRRNRTPTSREATTCCDLHLAEELERVQPKLIVALGNTALYALTKNKKIWAQLNKTFTTKYFPKAPVIPCVHPSAVLHSRGSRLEYPTLTAIIHTMNRVKRIYLNQESGLPILTYTDSLPDKDVVGLDIEGTSLVPEEYSFHVVECCVSWDSKYTTFSLPKDTQKLLDILGRQKLVLGHNIKYDLRVLTELGERAGIKDIRKRILNLPVICTMTLYGLLNPGYGRLGLEHLVSMELGIDTSKYKIEQVYTKIAQGKKDETVTRVCSLDAHFAVQLFAKLKKAHKAYIKDNIGLITWLCGTVVKVASQIEHRGIPLDIIEIKRQTAANRLRMNLLHTVLSEEIGNPRSGLQVGNYIAENIPKEYKALIARTPTGRIDTSKGHLREMLAQLPDDLDLRTVLSLLIKYREASKRISTYLDRFRKSTPIARPNIFLISNYDPGGKTGGAITGRITTELYATVPKGTLRWCIRSGHGLLVNIDYVMAEVYCVAVIANESALLEAYADGVDIHRLTASLLFGKNMEEVTDVQRSVGKWVNFSMIYGITPNGLRSRLHYSAGIDITLDEACRYIETFFSSYPRIINFHNKIASLVGSGKDIVSPTGRRLYTTDPRKAINFPVQSFASDITILGMTLLEEHGYEPILSSYDSVLVHVQDYPKDLERMVDELDYIMTVKTAGKFLSTFGSPLPVLPRVEITYGRRWK